MRKKLLLLPVVAGFLFVSCSTMGDYDYTYINQSLDAGLYADAYASVEADNEKIYKSHADVLVNLDKGVLSHYAGEYERSNTELTQAERKIEEYYTKSVTQTISSYLINDNVMDYEGEVFEDVYTNIFMALNYINMGNIEDAFVEIRRFDNKLRVASARYSDLIAQANEESAASGGESVAVPQMEFHNSALARYLSMLLYRSRGQLDSAAIDMKYLDSAFASQPKIYGFPKPRSLEEELAVPAGKARLNILSFTGKAPIKIEEEIRLYSVLGDFYYKIAYPIMVGRNSEIASIQATLIPASLSGSENQVKAFSMEPIESISSIAMDTFSQRQSLIYLRAMIRSIAKVSTTAVWGGLADGVSDDGYSAMFSILQLASIITTEATERADVRCSRYFPDLAWVAGITVDPGEYILSIEYKNHSGKTIAQEQESVVVRADGLNLVESICLR